jgi:predicted TIM-barrel fold metal-dependent hydrolase
MRNKSLAIGLLLVWAGWAAGQAAPIADYHQHLFGPSAITARDVVGLLDQAGIQRAIVLSTAYMHAKPDRSDDGEQARVRSVNDWTAAQAAEYPDRLRAFCSFNPLKPYALDELERCAANPNLHYGIKLHFANSDVQLENPAHVEQLARIFRAANEHRMAIVAHLRANITKNRPYGAAQARVLLEQLLPLVPDVPVVIAHLAGAGGYDDPAADEAMAVFADAVEHGDPRTSQLWFDVASVVDPSISESNAALVVKRIRQVGSNRILYGTDAAVGNAMRPREGWAAFRKLTLSDAEFSTIAGNVAPFLR